MAQPHDERREFQRLSLDKPIAARLGDVEVRIVDLGVAGARVESSASFPSAAHVTLRFESPRGPITLQSEIVHRAGSRAGLQFLSAPNGSDETLRRLLADLVTAAIGRLRGSGVTATGGLAFDPEATGMRIPVPYLSLRLEGGVWRKRGAFIPIQPETGFTLPATEDSEEITRLAGDYERAGEKERQLIRLFAELRVCEALRVPAGV